MRSALRFGGIRYSGMLLSSLLFILLAGFPTNGHAGTGQADEQILPPVSGPAVGEFLAPNGRFDLDAARRLGYEGPIDVRGFRSAFDPATVGRRAAVKTIVLSAEIPFSRLTKARFPDLR